MKYKLWLRVCAVLSAAFCLFACCSPICIADSAQDASSADSAIQTNNTSVTEAPAGMVCAAQNERYSLYVMSSGELTGEFYLRDDRDGLSWYSNPQDKAYDTSANGSPKFEMFSQVVLYGYDTASNGEKTVNSYIGAKRGEQVKVELLPDGFRTVYFFENDKVEISLYVTLADDHVELRCPLDELKETGTYRVVEIAIAPYFGCGSATDDGYLVIPDGSGAMIRFNNGKSNTAPYTALLYGENASLAGERKLTNPQTAALPVFGINRNQTGLLGVIREGDAEAEVVAYVSGQRNSRNTAYANFIVRNVDTVIIGESGLSQTKEVVQYDLEHKNMNACAVHYYPLESGKYSYADMAEQYREILLEQYGVTAKVATESPFFAELYAGVVRPQTFFGLTFRIYDVMTDYATVSDIRQELLDSGVEDVTVLYRNWSKDESKYKLQNKLRPVSALGSKSAFRDMINEGIYLSFSPLTIRRNGNGFWTFLDASKRMSKEPVLLYTYRLSTYYKNSEVQSGYLPTIAALNKAMESFSSSAEHYNAERLYLTDMGSMLYTNFDRKKYSSREMLMKEIQSACENMETELVVRQPNGYILPYTDVALNLPMSSSMFDVEDASIPFYQLVLNGMMPYSSEAVNLSSNPRRTVLQCLETASGLYFTWIGESGATITETDLNHLYGADYSRWKDYAVEAQKELDAVFAELGSRVIRDHEILADGVARTVYDSGKSIVINYTDVSVETAYGVVSANGYLVA